jgi:hypothetical protein
MTWHKSGTRVTLRNMAGITTIGHRTSIPTLYDNFFFTSGRLRRHPLTVALADELDAVRPAIDAAWFEELGLIQVLYESEALMEILDSALDGIVDSVQATLLVDLRGNRSSPIYLHYFGSMRPSDLKRPVLRGQVDSMRGWPTSLAASNNATLQEHGVTLTGLLTQADAAIQTNDGASQAFKYFRELGTRARLIDRFNALRKSVYGSLGQIQHNNPQLGTGWAESFFRSGGGSERVTLAEIERRIASAQVQLEALQAERDRLAAEEDRVAEARAAAERVEKQASLDAARAAAETLAAKIAELEADLGTEPAPATDPEIGRKARPGKR